MKRARSESSHEPQNPAMTCIQRYYSQVKEEVDGELFNTFNKILQDCRYGRINLYTTLRQMSELFKHNKQLISGLNALLPEGLQIPSDYGRYNWLTAGEASIDFLNKIRKTCNDDDDVTYERFLHIMDRCESKSADINFYNEVCADVEALFQGEPNLYLEFTRFVPDCFLSKNAQMEEERSREMCWISEKSCFRNRGKNHSEEILFECEDHQFKIDMLVNAIKSAKEHAEKLVNDHVNQELLESSTGVTVVEAYFTVHDLSCIEVLYDDLGADVVRQLKRAPLEVARIILPRLMERYTECVELRQSYLKLWARVYKEHHPKALDHVSYYVDEQKYGQEPSEKSGASCGKLGNYSGAEINDSEDHKEDGFLAAEDKQHAASNAEFRKHSDDEKADSPRRGI